MKGIPSTAVEALNSVLTEVAEMYVMCDGESSDMAWFMNILQSRIAEIEPEYAHSRQRDDGQWEIFWPATNQCTGPFASQYLADGWFAEQWQIMRTGKKGRE